MNQKLTKAETIMLSSSVKIGAIYPRGRHVSSQKAEQAVAKGLLERTRTPPGAYRVTNAGRTALQESGRG